jgi:hypothetical protein
MKHVCIAQLQEELLAKMQEQPGDVGDSASAAGGLAARRLQEGFYSLAPADGCFVMDGMAVHLPGVAIDDSLATKVSASDSGGLAACHARVGSWVG